MKIIWNEVTWYSKLAAVILFLVIVPCITFYIGFKYGEVKTLIQSSGYSEIVSKK